MGDGGPAVAYWDFQAFYFCTVNLPLLMVVCLHLESLLAFLLVLHQPTLMPRPRDSIILSLPVY